MSRAPRAAVDATKGGIPPRLVALAVIGVAIAGAAGYLLFFPFKPAQPLLPTYFRYEAAELEPLRAVRSQVEIRADDLYEWAERAFLLVSRNTQVTGFDPNTSRLYAYLLVAQHDAANISFNLTGRFRGSIAPVSRDVLCLFFENDCSRIARNGSSDEYSHSLARIVVAKVKARMASDDAQTFAYQRKVGAHYWTGDPMIGIADGSRKTWLIQSGKQFRVVPPPGLGSPEFKAQLAMVQEARRNVTLKKRAAVAFWAGGPGTKTPPGIWIEIADTYMRGHAVTVQDVLTVRAALAMAIADANIAVFDSKYTYWVKRPFMLDRSIVTIMPTPSHPSYPAGHSTLSAAAAIVLSHFFPSEQSRWMALAQEAGHSRVWGGIHYPMDDAQGFLLGEKVARAALLQFPFIRTNAVNQ